MSDARRHFAALANEQGDFLDRMLAWHHLAKIGFATTLSDERFLRFSLTEEGRALRDQYASEAQKNV